MYPDVKTDDAGNCIGCGAVYSFYFGCFFHVMGCPESKRCLEEAHIIREVF